MKPYIKLPKLKPIPDSSFAKRNLSDNVWINYVFHIILKYYKEIEHNEIISVVKQELEKQNSQIEKALKEHLYKWYKRTIRTDNRVDIWGIILNLEPSSENLEGFYDLKFQHSDWNKYFVFEAKNLGDIKSRNNSSLVNEYVYVKTKDREDGGMYRFMIKKYANEVNFGGMLGFVVGKYNGNIISNLTNKIREVYESNVTGELVNNKIIFNSINNNTNTFTSNHLRNQDSKEFHLYHIIMDFTKN